MAGIRFGFGFDINAGQDITKFPHLGAWYLNWDLKRPTTPGLEHLALIGGWRPSTKAAIESAAAYLAANAATYPNGSRFVIGNEIGWDDGRTPERYAKDFTAWYERLKTINSTWLIAHGALVSLDWKGPDYINKVWRELKGLRPDFYTMHGYTPEAWADVAAFKQQCIHMREWMARRKLNIPLWMTEFAPLGDRSNVRGYMQETVSWLQSQDYVQRWAWFILNPVRPLKKGQEYDALYLTDKARNLTALGRCYRNLYKSERR